MSSEDDVEQFAALLRRLKNRTDRSYGSLARRLAMNTSTLHRYCAGEAVPQDYAPVERLAAFCGATPEERLELHRLWLLAVTGAARAVHRRDPTRPRPTRGCPRPTPGRPLPTLPDHRAVPSRRPSRMRPVRPDGPGTAVAAPSSAPLRRPYCW